MSRAKLTDAVTIPRGALICDAPGCGYEEPLEKIPAPPSLIGKPCPKCGANLLTEDDYNAAQKLFAAVANINAEIGPVKASGKKPLVRAFNPRASA